MRALLILALVAANAAAAQPALVSEASVDQEAYAYGETITFRYRIANEGEKPYTFWTSAQCFVGITFGSLTLPNVCPLVDDPFPFKPGDSKTWAWVLVPSELGVPEGEGMQTIWGHLGALHLPEIEPTALPLAASATFRAPRYLGGPLSVGFDAADADTVAALRESLGAEVTTPSHATDGPTSEEWQLNGVALTDAIEVLRANSFIRYAERAPAQV